MSISKRISKTVAHNQGLMAMQFSSGIQITGRSAVALQPSSIPVTCCLKPGFHHCINAGVSRLLEFSMLTNNSCTHKLKKN